jgi:molybdate transport system ATP-binding protein
MGLSVRLKKKVKGFSLDVKWEIGDELAVLFGYSGSGKSMTLQMITGLLRPDEGFIRLPGPCPVPPYDSN